MDDIIKEFLVESHENLDRLERDLVTLEKSPSSKDLLAGIFRTIHTIKGSSGFLGLGKLETVAHAGENLLSRLRDGKLVLNQEITNVLLALVDAIRNTLANLAQSEKEGDRDDSKLIAELNRLIGGAAPAPTAKPAPPKEVKPAVAAAPTPAPVETPPAPPPAPEKPIAVEAVAPPIVDAPSENTSATSASESNVRVGVGLLDKLMNLVGELVLARNQILQLSEGREDAIFTTASQRLNLVTTELQEEIMKTRLQPIGNVWAKFPRVVRDISQELSKKVRLEMEGKETELDRTIIEAIKDPLTHLVRNAVDHGIETPERRKAAGKAEIGFLALHAYHEGGQVNIEITDDGKGIDVSKVKAKALERGIISPDQAARMGERELLHLIFLPGLSTADKITNVSGRGVGMDVVKTNIEKIGGSVDIQTELGRGTKIKIKIPLTLAIIPALMVTCGGERYAIPQVSLVELVRLDGEQARKGIEMIMGTPVYRLRGHLLPLVNLSKALQVGDAGKDSAEAVNIVVVQADDHQFGVVVDKINDTQEIVVKPLGKHLKGIPVFAGATILGDGKVALILDVLGLAQSERVISKARDRKLSEESTGGQETAVERQRLLLFSMGEDRRLAIDLSTVGRLENFSRTQVERSGTREVVQYRGQIMSLIRLSDCLNYNAGGDGDTMQVVVYSKAGRSVGLVVGHILDIVEDVLRLQCDDQRMGVLGKTVIQGKVTEVLDVPAIVTNYCPEFAKSN